MLALATTTPATCQTFRPPRGLPLLLREATNDFRSKKPARWYWPFPQEQPPEEVKGNYIAFYTLDPALTRHNCILIPLDPVHMLILISKTVFVSVRTPLVAIPFSTNAQLVSSDLLSCRDGGVAKEAAEESVDAQR
jgi:hypothetical protein